MVFMMTFAVVAVMIAQAVNVENKLDLALHLFLKNNLLERL